MCAPRKYIGRRGNRTWYPRALSQPRYQRAILAYIYPCRDPCEALQGPFRCPGGARPIYFTLYSGPVRDTYGHRPSAGNVFRKWWQVSSDSRPGTRRDPPGLRQGICNALVTIHKRGLPGQFLCCFWPFFGGTPTGCRPFFSPHKGPGLLLIQT